MTIIKEIKNYFATTLTTSFSKKSKVLVHLKISFLRFETTILLKKAAY